MKVLLINPPSRAPNPVLPLGLAFIAAALARANNEVMVVDAWAEGLNQEQIGSRVAQANSDIVGVTMMSPLYEAGIETVRTVRKNSKAFIVAGGPHPSAMAEQCLEALPELDYVVVGEGEIAFVALIEGLQRGAAIPGMIKGVACRDKGVIVQNGVADRIVDLDILDFPSFRLFPLKKYKTHPPYGIKKRYATIITSRGCPFHCSYCSKSVFGTVYRAMSPERVVAWIQRYKEEFGVEEVHFYDDDFTMDMKRAGKICDLMIANGTRLAWSCTTRVDLVDQPLLEKMKRSGCWLISYGVESADDWILRGINKGYSIADVEKAFAMTKLCGISTVGFFMAGLPGETRESLKKTIGFSLALNPDFVSWGITAVYPGSLLYESLRKRGDTPCTSDYALEATQGHASGSPFGDGCAVLYDGALSREELENHVKQANRLFYLRWSYLFSFMFRIRSVYHCFHYFSGGLKVIWWMLKDSVASISGKPQQTAGHDTPV